MQASLSLMLLNDDSTLMRQHGMSMVSQFSQVSEQQDPYELIFMPDSKVQPTDAASVA